MSERLAVDLVHLDGTAVLMLRGEIDIASAPVFSSAMERVMSLGIPVVLDFAGVTFMDSSGLKVLLIAQTTGPSGSLDVRNPSPQVRRLLAITGLDRVISADTTTDVAGPQSDAPIDNSRTR